MSEVKVKKLRRLPSATVSLESVAVVSKHDSEIIEALKCGYIVIDAYIGNKKYRTMIMKPGEKKPI